VGGGAEVYRALMPPLADMIYLTQVHGKFGDTFFPEIDDSFRLTEVHRVDEDHPYAYQPFERSVST
jgi:dihydrofolate reductase